MAETLRRDLEKAGALPEGGYTIDEFCDAFRISRSEYYKLKKAGRGPRIMHVGRRVISFAAAAEWRREREQEGAAAL